MLKVRVIPTLLWKNVGVVKGVGFNSWRRVGAALPAIKVYNTRDVDELILLDITATAERRDPDYETISELSAECFVPLTVGGGVGATETIRNLLRSGADKVAINSASYQHPQLVSEAAYTFGSQCIVASVDVRRTTDGIYQCWCGSGAQPTGRDPGEWAAELEHLGAGEILLTSIERDGTMSGYDIDLIQRVTKYVSIPVIASGGAGSYQHLCDAVLVGGASAVAAASMFHFTEQTPGEAKEFMQRNGIPVRLSTVRGGGDKRLPEAAYHQKTWLAGKGDQH